MADELEKGVYVIGSFSRGTKDKARIRVQLSAAHTKHLDKAMRHLLKLVNF
jgi:hypothetical protein